MSQPPGHADPPAAAPDPDALVVEALTEDLDAIAAGADGPREEFTETRELLEEAGARGLIDSSLRHLHPRDAAEAFVGSVIFASPLLVEDGVFDIAAHLFETTVAGAPVFLVANTVFVVVMTYALVEWTGRDQDETHHLLGVVPTRVVMILAVSFAVAALLMTVWGRVGGWGQPAEAIARINVLWTVGAIGGGLGDILSVREGRPTEASVASSQPASVAEDGPPDRLSDAALLTTLNDQLDDLESIVGSEARRRELVHLRIRAQEAAVGRRFGNQIHKYTTRDIAEAFVGSVVFAIPFLVEDGVFDVADYFLAFRVGGFPVFFLLNAGFVLGMILALVYWAGPQDVQVSRPVFGLVPRRLVGIALVSFLAAAMLMTMWGRVGGWQDPVVAVARISAVWTVASFGAALGDILPGESSGADLYDDLAELGERVGDGSGTD